jgi:hypothetical protein
VASRVTAASRVKAFLVTKSPPEAWQAEIAFADRFVDATPDLELTGNEPGFRLASRAARSESY